MEKWVSQAIERLSAEPLLQGTLAAVCTFVLEDPTTLGCALLVADGKMAFSVAFIGLAIGIALGDWALYGLGRFLGPRTVRWGLVSQRRLDRAGTWFARNLVAAVFISRFVPGLRLPTNIGAGLIRASPARFLPVALAASIIWTFVALGVISKLGEVVLPYLGMAKWPIGIALVLLLVLVQVRSSRYLDEDIRSDEAREEPVTSVFEFWPPTVFYAPVAVYYLWLALRYRSFTLPTVANPSIYSGGIIRESKSEILEMLPEDQRKWAAPHVRFDNVADLSADERLTAAERLLAAAGIAYPIVAKPDQGQRGEGVQPVRDSDELAAYLASFPIGAAICLQQLAPYDHEAGILYHRHPGESTGHITSVTLKEFPFVIGDGRRTLRELIEADERARELKKLYFRRHEARLNDVLQMNAHFQLVFAGNHKQGCVFRNGIHILTPDLERRFDEIARSISGFHFGRFDVRFADLPALQRGEEFLVVEINGAGAESTHIWDPAAKLTDAYATLFTQFRTLFQIGDANRRLGHRPLGPVRLLKDVFDYHRVARHYPGAK